MSALEGHELRAYLWNVMKNLLPCVLVTINTTFVRFISKSVVCQARQLITSCSPRILSELYDSLVCIFYVFFGP